MRQNEEHFAHYMYNWQYWDKRNRLCHNMIMEHFEVHKEQLEDLIVDVQKHGPKVLMDIPAPKKLATPIDINDLALIDELSGLTSFIDNFLKQHDLPETVRQRIKARMFEYNSEVPKEVRLNEIREAIFGQGR